jgi:hypothetical protein
MDPDRDVLDKADALLKRHAPRAPGGGSDTGGIPVLTDLVDPAPAAAPAPRVTLDDRQRALVQDIFKAVMAQVEDRLATELERRLTDHLIDEVHVAVAAAIGDLRPGLADVIGDAISEALAARRLED